MYLPRMYATAAASDMTQALYCCTVLLCVPPPLQHAFYLGNPSSPRRDRRHDDGRGQGVPASGGVAAGDGHGADRVARHASRDGNGDVGQSASLRLREGFHTVLVRRGRWRGWGWGPGTAGRVGRWGNKMSHHVWKSNRIQLKTAVLNARVKEEEMHWLLFPLAQSIELHVCVE